MARIRSTLMDDIATKTCPVCAKYVPRRRNNCCPHCNTPIDGMRVRNRGHDPDGGKWRTIWVRSGGSTKELVLMLRSYIRTKTGNPEWEFANLGAEYGAAGLLLAYCKGEMDIAKLVIDAHFNPDAPRKVWLDPRSMTQIVSPKCCINAALNWAKAQAKIPERKEPVRQLGLEF